MAEKSPAIGESPTVVTHVAAPPPTIIVERKSSLVGTALTVLLALVGGGGGVWFIQEHGHTSAAQPNLRSTASESVVHLDGFTVNLADSEEGHFLRVTIELGMAHLPAPSDGDKPNSGLPMARMRDTILAVLTLGKADVLLTPTGKQQLKKDLLEALNRQNPELGIREIYFTEFLVQK